MPNAPVSPFADRLSHHPYIASFADPTKGRVLARNNQLLVGEKALAEPGVAADLDHAGWTRLTSLLDGIHNPTGVEDTVIFEHALFQPPVDDTIPPDVVGEVRTLRKKYPGLAEEFSPNHVLVAAPWGSQCPDGPPRAVKNQAIHALPAISDKRQSVTVIDSGWQWGQGWGQNPLGNVGPGERVVDVSEAEWPSGSFSWTPGNLVPPYVAGAMVGPQGWAQGTPDTAGEFLADDMGNALRWDATQRPPTLVPSVEPQLVALAGHANFVAGVIAQLSPAAEITVRNFNGAFQPWTADFPDEVSVARALIKSAQGGADLINVGFAFWPLDGIPHTLWTTAFKLIGTKVVVVAPAGNQGVATPRYPAALNHPDPHSLPPWAPKPGLFTNIIGVASIRPTETVKVSGFTNRGPWVRCSAVGEGVISTFLHVDMAVEEGPPTLVGKQDFTGNNWAKWNGTSFAAPRVTARICQEMANHASAATAASAALLATGTHNASLGQALRKI